MAPVPQRKLEQLLRTALQLEDPERHAFLESAAADYPELASELAALLTAGDTASSALSGESEPLLLQPPVSPGAFAGTDRFALLNHLGAGGFGDVYEVFDRALGIRLAVKVLRRADAATVESFKSEFRVLERLHHRNICQLYELIFESQAGCWLLVMEKIEGRPLLDYLRRPSAELRSVFRQAAEGLAALHRHGVLHCDIKPSNMLVEAGGRVVLLDFGLARRIDTQLPADALTFRYAAPEVQGGAPHSAASDWYSFGAMLRRALPLAAPDTELAELAGRLLETDPDARAGAAEVLAVLAGSATAGEPAPLFVGREEQLRMVEELFATRLEQGRGATVEVSGASGIGKTAFVHRALDIVRRRIPHLQVFEGRCHQGESVPYNAVDELVDQIAVYLRQMPLGDARELWPAELALLARVFPVLETVLPRAPGAPAVVELRDTQEVRRRAFAAFRELLTRMAARAPLAVVIDDLQWSDSDSTQLLRELLEGPNAPPALILLAYRAEADPAPAGFVPRPRQPGAAVCEISLGPLGEEQAQRLAGHLVPPGHWGTAREIARESGGSPLFLRQLAAYARAGTRAAGVQELIAGRVAGLPEAERRFLDVLSVARTPLPLLVLRDAAALGDQVLATRRALAVEHLVRAAGPAQDAVLPYHDRIAEVVADRLPPDRLRAIHEQLAVTLESHSHPDAETMAGHYHAAGRLADAARLGQVAAERAVSVLAFDRAAALYGKVITWGSFSPAELSALERARGDALVNCGRGSQAARAFERAMSGAAAVAVPELQARFASELLRSGEVAEGMSALRRLLREQGLPFPEGRAQCLARLGWERVRLAWRLRQWRRGPRPGAQPSAAQAARLDACWAAAVGTGMVYPLLTEIYCALHLRLALEYGAQDRLALAWSSYASRLAYADDGVCRAAKEMMREAERCAVHDGRPYTIAFLTTMRATIAMLTGDFPQADTEARRALDQYRGQCVGVAWEMATAASYLHTARTVMGQWDSSGDVASLIQEARDRGDRYAEVNLRLLTGSYAGLLVQDQPDEAELQVNRCLADWPQGEFDLQQLYALQARVDLELYRGRPAAAWAHLERAWPALRGSGLLQIDLLRNFAVSQRARAALAVAATRPEGPEGRRLLRLAERTARSLIQRRARYAAGLGWVLAGGAARLRGDFSQAREYLERAEIELERHGLIPWLAATRLALASLTEEDEAATKKQAMAMNWMSSQNVRRPECLARMLLPSVCYSRPLPPRSPS